MKLLTFADDSLCTRTRLAGVSQRVVVGAVVGLSAGIGVAAACVTRHPR